MSERAEAGDFKDDVMKQYNYPDMTKTQTRGTARFVLHVEGGSFTDSEIIVLLGENGTGKTTFVRMLAGLLMLDHVGFKVLSLSDQDGHFSIDLQTPFRI